MSQEVDQSKRDIYYSVSAYKIGLYSIWLFLCVCSSKFNYLGALLSVGEFLLVVFCISMKRYGDAYIILALSLTFSLEEKSFVYQFGIGHELYSVYRLPAVSVFPFYFITCLLFVMIYQRYSKKAKSNGINLLSIVHIKRFMPILFITGVLTGLITQLVNDNGISNYSWALTMLIASCLRILSLFAFIGSAMYLVVGLDGFRLRIEKCLTEVLFAFFFASIATIALGWHGYYANYENIMLLPLASSLCPLLMVFPAFFKIKRPMLYYIASITFTIESVFYNSLMGSKFYIIPLLCLFICVLVVVKNGRLKNILMISIILSFLVINADSILSMVTGSEYGVWKFTQFSNLFSFRGGITDWYNNVDASPRFRIDEFVNILLEYIKKPWYFLFGKGISGSIIHHWGTTDWFRKNGTFQGFQIESGIFVSMHESLNVIFLRHGLFGLCFFTISVIDLFKKMVKSPWAVGAIVWFVFYWGIYFSWWTGAIMLVLALTQNDETKK